MFILPATKERDTVKRLLLIASLVFLNVSPGFAETGVVKPLRTDLILEVVPIKTRSILAGGKVDALEKSPSEMPPVWTAVVFRVNRVLMGSFKSVIIEEPPLREQMKTAVKEKKIWKFLTMDFKKTDEEGIPRKWLTLAVADPYASFGIKEGEPSPRQRYKLYLSLAHKNPDSYVLVKSEKIV